MTRKLKWKFEKVPLDSAHCEMSYQKVNRSWESSWKSETRTMAARISRGIRMPLL